MEKNPAARVQDHLVFGEFGGVNASIEDSSTFTFLQSSKMQELFEHEIEGCFLYSRHLNPTGNYLARSLAAMEGAESAIVTASGMSAFACTIAQICSSGDDIISSRTIYGGSYALLKNLFPKFGISTTFVDIVDLESLKRKITPKTKIIFSETLSNPLLEAADIPALRGICDETGITLIIDNTFCPMMISPKLHGAHITVYSLTKFINGASDTIAGAICGDSDFISSLRDVNSGAVMLLGPTLDSIRASSILKNLHTLHIRMQRHSQNALFLAHALTELGVKVFYPGLDSHPQHKLIEGMLNPGYGFGGMITLDARTEEIANSLMIKMQEKLVGYFAVSLGFYKTLFSSPGHSTSSEIPLEEQIAIGLTEGLVRISVGLDDDIERTFLRIKGCLEEVGLI
ncbi:MAG: Methionine-gamma-lyase [Ignavibacteria bacterium]|nr:Methionine-gamma-lyase [Ignavibacteria bacterium]